MANHDLLKEVILHVYIISTFFMVISAFILYFFYDKKRERLAKKGEPFSVVMHKSLFEIFWESFFAISLVFSFTSVAVILIFARDIL